MWLPVSFFKPKSEKTLKTEKWSTLTFRKSIITPSGCGSCISFTGQIVNFWNGRFSNFHTASSSLWRHLSYKGNGMCAICHDIILWNNAKVRTENWGTQRSQWNNRKLNNCANFSFDGLANNTNWHFVHCSHFPTPPLGSEKYYSTRKYHRAKNIKLELNYRFRGILLHRPRPFLLVDMRVSGDSIFKFVALPRLKESEECIYLIFVPLPTTKNDNIRIHN